MSEKTVKSAGRLEHPFEVASITPAKAPEGAMSASWFRYEIAQGDNAIVGHREGTLKAVTQAVSEIVMRLNERRQGKTGRVHLTPGPKKSRSA